MKSAISELEISLHTSETNEPIARANGKIERADNLAICAADFRQALAVLRAANNGPIWPEPKA